MKLFRSFLVAALLGASAPALAQINVVPQTGLTTGYLPKQTFSAFWVGLVPPASATDVVCIAGSSTKTIRLMSIKISGTATTAINLPLTVLRRTLADTAGTAGTTTANPANTISARDTGTALATAATATLISYTAVPTINDTSPTYIDSAYANFGTSATNAPGAFFDFAKDTENQLQMPTVRGAAQQICLNFNATSIGAAGTTTGSITWTEE